MAALSYPPRLRSGEPPSLLVTGARRQGKTNYTRALVSRRACTITIDPTGTVRGGIVSEDVVTVCDAVRRFPVADIVWHIPMRLTEPGAGPALESAIGDIVRAAGSTPWWVTIATDEMSVVAPRRSIVVVQALRNAAAVGRHNPDNPNRLRRVSIILLTQAQGDIGATWRAVVDYFVCFRAAGPTEWKAVGSLAGQKAKFALMGASDYSYLLIDATDMSRWRLMPPVPLAG